MQKRTALLTALALCIGLAATAIIEVVDVSSFVGTITFKVQLEKGGTLYTISGKDLSADSAASTATAAGLFRFDVTGAYAIYADITAYTSGTVSVNGRIVKG